MIIAEKSNQTDAPCTSSAPQFDEIDLPISASEQKKMIQPNGILHLHYRRPFYVKRVLLPTKNDMEIISASTKRTVLVAIKADISFPVSGQSGTLVPKRGVGEVYQRSLPPNANAPHPRGRGSSQWDKYLKRVPRSSTNTREEFTISAQGDRNRGAIIWPYLLKPTSPTKTVTEIQTTPNEKL